MHQQLLANAWVTASSYFLFGLAFAGVYRIGRFFDVTPAVGFIAGAYIGHWLASYTNFPLPLAIGVPVVIAGMLGMLLAYVQNLTAYRHRSPGEKFVASLALVIVCQSAAALWRGDDTKVFPWAIEVLHFGSVGVTSAQLSLCTFAVGVWVVVAVLFYGTSWGRLYRAVASDPELAAIHGVRVPAVALVSGIVCMALAAAIGILVGADVGVTPTMGFKGILFGVIAVVIGGAESLAGIALGALLLAVTQHLVSFYLGGHWQDVAVFLVLATFLLVRPYGLLGRPVRKAAV